MVEESSFRGGDIDSDSNTLVKRYVSETGAAFVTGITDPAAGHHAYP